MGTYIFDLESDGLLDNITKIHCLVIKDYETGTVYPYVTSGYPYANAKGSIEDGLIHLSKSSTIVGHNIIDYDLRAIKKLYPEWEYKGVIRDTLIIGKVLFADLKDRDMILFKKGKLDGKLIGRHSLKAWGYRLGFLKGTYGETADWSTITQEMIEYCELDVEVTSRLYHRCLTETFIDEVIESEQETHRICLEQTKFGFPFNRKKAQGLESLLVAKKSQINQDLLEQCGRGWFVNLGEKVSPRNVKYKDVLRGDETQGSKWTKVKYIDFNPNSRAHLSKVLQQKFGWKPTEFGKDGHATIDEETLKTLKHPIVELIKEYLMLEKRLGQLSTGAQAWLLLEKEGKIHGRIDTVGAVTSRCTHSNPNMSQIPSNDAPYGKECRELFEPPKGWKMFGTDVSGLELRLLAHYMARYDDGAYGKVILEGDIHSHNQKAAGLETRGQAKTMIYCYLYGGGNEKLGETIGGTKEHGARLRSKLLAGLPALKSLGDAVATRAKSGRIKGLDGRTLIVRHQHAALNTLLQSAGAIICKRWVNRMHKLLKEEGFTHGKEFTQLTFSHDELQIGYDPSKLTSEFLGTISMKAIQEIGIELSVRIPLATDSKEGDNYAETH